MWQGVAAGLGLCVSRVAVVGLAQLVVADAFVPGACAPVHRSATSTEGSSTSARFKIESAFKSDASVSSSRMGTKPCGSTAHNEGAFEDIMEQLVRTLEEDLPLQYQKPQDLSIFANSVEFQDPVTTVRGKLQYRGMLFFTLLFFRVACKADSSFFNVSRIERPGKRLIRTVWETGAETWNGRHLFISGVDDFAVNDEGRIARHDSAWDQTWEQVRSQIV